MSFYGFRVCEPDGRAAVAGGKGEPPIPKKHKNVAAPMPVEVVRMAHHFTVSQNFKISKRITKYRPLNDEILKVASEGAPKTFLITFTRCSNFTLPPQEAHRNVYEFIQRKSGLKGRWNGLEIAPPAVEGMPAGSALPGIGDVVWAGKVHKCGPAWGTAKSSATYGDYRKVSELLRDFGELLHHPDSCFIFAMTSADNGPSCNPAHLGEWLDAFTEQEGNERGRPALERIFFCIQKLGMYSDEAGVNDRYRKYYTSFSALELRNGIQNRIPLTTPRPQVNAFLMDCSAACQSRLAMNVLGGAKLARGRSR